MKLPDPIEHAIVEIEYEWEQQTGQYAKAHALRYAIENVLRDFGISYRNWKEIQPREGK